MKTWIIEDDPATRMLVKTLAASAIPTEVRDFPSAEAALAALASDPPDLCLVDIDLPGKSGIECVHEIRTTLPSGSEHIPYIIMVTSHDSPDVLDEVFRAGANDFFSKPVHAKVLQTRMQIARRLISQAVMQVESDYCRTLIAYAFNHAATAMAVVERSEPANGLPLLFANRALRSLLGSIGGEDIIGHPITATLQCPDDFAARITAAAAENRVFTDFLATHSEPLNLAGLTLTLEPVRDGDTETGYALLRLDATVG